LYSSAARASTTRTRKAVAESLRDERAERSIVVAQERRAKAGDGACGDIAACREFIAAERDLFVPCRDVVALSATVRMIFRVVADFVSGRESGAPGFGNAVVVQVKAVVEERRTGGRFAGPLHAADLKVVVEGGTKCLSMRAW